jgi:hypothetical protein
VVTHVITYESGARESGIVRNLLGSVHEDAEQWAVVGRRCCQIKLEKIMWIRVGRRTSRLRYNQCGNGLEPRNRCFKIDDAGCCPIGRTATGSKIFPSPRRDGDDAVRYGSLAYQANGGIWAYRRRWQVLAG